MVHKLHKIKHAVAQSLHYFTRDRKHCPGLSMLITQHYTCF